MRYFYKRNNDKLILNQKPKIMKNYFFETYEKTVEAAFEAQKNTPNTYVMKSSYRCECGDSFACYLYDFNTLDDLGTFIHCEACCQNNQ